MEIKNDVANNRFVTSVNGSEAVLLYKRSPAGVLDMISVRVPQEARGQGIADLLVQAALKMAKEEGLRIIPTCPYVKKWFEKHLEEKQILQ